MPYDNNNRVVNWKHKVDIKVVLNDKTIPDREKPGKIADILEKNKSKFHEAGDRGCNDWWITGMIEDLRDLDGAEDEFNYDEDEVNDLLRDLYDFADDHLIWLGV